MNIKLTTMRMATILRRMMTQHECTKSFGEVVLQNQEAIGKHILTTYVPKAAKRASVMTNNDQLSLITIKKSQITIQSRGLFEFTWKLKWLYILYHNASDHQTWSGGDMQSEVPN